MSQQDSLTQDTVYDLLSNARRRFVLSFLRGRDEPIELSELSKRVAAWENDTAVEELTDQQVKRVYVSLYQTHIPKLADSGLVDYDKETGEVSLTSNIEEIDTYLPEDDQRQIPWQFVYAGVAVVGLAVYVARATFPAAFEAVSMTALNVVIIAAFGVVAAVHYWMRSRR
jgi:hypothetical protein